MGANAVTSIPDFVALQVLTADELNVVNCGIPVFADSSARDAAFGGSGEKTLAEGQYAFLEDTNATQFYDGSTWQAVGVTPALVPMVPTSVAVGSGSATTSANGQVAFTGVSSVSLNGVFNSTYDNYRILFRPNAASTTQNIAARFRVAGVDSSASYVENDIFNTGTSGVNSSQAGQTLIYVLQQNSPAQQEFAASTYDIYGPALAAPTVGHGANINVYVAPNSYLYLSQFRHAVSTAYDGITFIPSAGTMGGTISVYGYTK